MNWASTQNFHFRSFAFLSLEVTREDAEASKVGWESGSFLRLPGLVTKNRSNGRSLNIMSPKSSV